MPWNTTAPDGTQSVKANESILQDNTTYTKLEMNKDHYWDTSANQDGHHTKVETDDQSADPAAVTLDSLYYSREKTATESPDVQKSEPFIYSQVGAVNHYLQLGFRGMVNFVGGATPSQANVKYSHNIATQSASPKGIVRDSEGLYTITFENALPSANYIVLGSTQRTGSTNKLYLSVISQTTTTCQVQFQYSGNDNKDPTLAMIAFIGG